YTSASFMSGIGNPSGFAEYPLFVAHWGVSCPNIPAPWSDWAFWQFTDSATVPGVPDPGATDADEFNGDASMFLAWLDAGSPASADAGPADAGPTETDGGPADGGSTG